MFIHVCFLFFTFFFSEIGSSGVELGFLGALSAKLILQILSFLTPESLCVVSQVQ